MASNRHQTKMTLNPFNDAKSLFIHLIKVHFVCLLLAAIALFTVDQHLALLFAQENISSYWNSIGRKLSDVGLAEYYFLFAILLYIYLRWMAPRLSFYQNSRERISFFRKWALNFFLALIVSGALVHILKFIFGRQRPHKSFPLFDPQIFDHFTTHWHWHSFPSGHSQTMFTVATMMTLAVPRLKWLWLAIAASVCFSRVIVLDHFFSDTIYGACVGYTGAMLTAFWMRNTKNSLYPTA